MKHSNLSLSLSSAKIEPTNKSFHPTSEFSIKRLIINNYNKLFFKNSDDPMEDILYKLVEKIIPSYTCI